MDEKFYNLPETKQQAIINAGYRVFSQNAYKKAPCRKLPTRQESANPFSSTIFITRRSCICFFGKPAEKSLWM